MNEEDRHARTVREIEASMTVIQEMLVSVRESLGRLRVSLQQEEEKHGRRTQ